MNSRVQVILKFIDLSDLPVATLQVGSAFFDLLNTFQRESIPSEGAWAASVFWKITLIRWEGKGCELCWQPIMDRRKEEHNE